MSSNSLKPINNGSLDELLTSFMQEPKTGIPKAIADTTTAFVQPLLDLRNINAKEEISLMYIKRQEEVAMKKYESDVRTSKVNAIKEYMLKNELSSEDLDKCLDAIKRI